jgi:hypothetical protein
MDVMLDLNEQVYYNDSVSVVKLPDMCADVPFDSARVCLKFYELDARNESLRGSADLLVKRDDIELRRIKLGSFRFRNGSSFFEKNLMKIYLNKKAAMNVSSRVDANGNSSNMSSLDQFYQSYDNFINKLTYFPLPKFSFNFQPDRLVNNLYNSLVYGRSGRKKARNETKKQDDDDNDDDKSKNARVNMDSSSYHKLNFHDDAHNANDNDNGESN